MPKQTKKQLGLCTTKRCTGQLTSASKYCAACLEWIARGRPCKRCGRKHRSAESICRSCRNFGSPAERRPNVRYRRTDDGSSMQHLRAALDSDPERQARIARYAEMAAQGLPLFNPNDRPSYIRSVRAKWIYGVHDEERQVALGKAHNWIRWRLVEETSNE